MIHNAPWHIEEDGNTLWVVDVHGFCVAGIQFKGFDGIAEFTEQDYRTFAEFMVSSMNAAHEPTKPEPIDYHCPLHDIWLPAGSDRCPLCEDMREI